MRYISLFSGIGGFDLGFNRAGMVGKAQVEIDKNCLQLLGDKFPEAKQHTDVKEFHYGKPIDLICGGFPCQDLSIAGKRAGLAGERSGLWFEFHRILAELTPRWVVIENVPGLLSSNGGRDFAVILRGLGDLGYLPTWRVLDAQYFGVAQRRRRVFIVASLGSGRSAEVLLESDGLPGDTPPSRETGKEVAYSLRSNPSHSGDKGDGGINTTLIARESGQGYWMEDIVSGTLDMNMGKSGHGSRPAIITDLSFGLNSRNNRLDAESQTLVPVAYGIYDEQTPKISENVMPTLRNRNEGGGFQQAVGGSFGVRRLTPVECERLQGFPDGWTAGFADTIRYRMLGNAVAVPVAEWIGRRIMENA
jgi:DNA (cytosine-5)-methyltransferase 1